MGTRWGGDDERPIPLWLLLLITATAFTLVFALYLAGK